MIRSLIRAAICCGCFAGFGLGLAQADVLLLGFATIPGDTADLSGLKGKQTDGTPHNRLGGLGSSITYAGKGDEYLLASDRGPKDGNSDFACRVHRMNITVRPNASPAVNLKLTATTLLSNEHGEQLVGSLDAVHPKHPEKSLRLDPEGVRVSRTGTFFLSDEYGPAISEFDVKGKRLRSLPVPERFLPTKPGKTVAEELPPHNLRGRQPNRGMEGLAISHDGRKLFGIMQSPLIQDGGLDKENLRIGTNCRMLEIEIGSRKTREFVYPLHEATNGVSEILAIGDDEFLVLERDSKFGKDAHFKKIFRMKLGKATDVSGVATLPVKGLPAGIQPVMKTPFLDLLESRFQIGGEECPEKFEGLAFGPDLPDGRHLLIVTADNDFVATAPFRVYAFAIDRADLPTFQPQKFDFKK